MVICLERGADVHMAQLMPLPLTVSCFSKIQIGFTFLVPATRVVPEKGPLNGCMCEREFDVIRGIFISGCERRIVCSKVVKNSGLGSGLGSGSDVTAAYQLDSSRRRLLRQCISHTHDTVGDRGPWS